MDPSRLKDIGLFAELPDDDLRRIATLALEKSVAGGTELAREGDFAYDMFVLEEGGAEVRHGGQTIAQLGPGDVVGEMGVLTKELRNADVVTTAPSRLIILSHWDVRRLRKNLPDLDERLNAIIESRRS